MQEGGGVSGDEKQADACPAGWELATSLGTTMRADPAGLKRHSAGGGPTRTHLLETTCVKRRPRQYREQHGSLWLFDEDQHAETRIVCTPS